MAEITIKVKNFPPMANTTTKRVYFKDEAPGIGAGWRQVEITIGRKWVHVRHVQTHKKAKFSKEQWRRIDSI